MKKVISVVLIFTSALLLQGCIAAAIGVGAGATAKVATDPRTAGVQVDDTSLSSRIGMKLKDQSEYFSSARVIVSAYNSDVILTGQATEEQRAKAGELANEVGGSKNIYNQIRLTEKASVGTIANDAWITAKVKSMLIANQDTKARGIKVVTEDSEVFLIGIVTEPEGQAAAEVASKVDGVRLVTTIFTFVAE